MSDHATKVSTITNAILEEMIDEMALIANELIDCEWFGLEDPNSSHEMIGNAVREVIADVTMRAPDTVSRSATLHSIGQVLKAMATAKRRIRVKEMHHARGR